MENNQSERFHRPPLTPDAEMLALLDKRPQLAPETQKARMVQHLFEAAAAVHLMEDNPELEAQTEATWAAMVDQRKQAGANNNSHYALAA